MGFASSAHAGLRDDKGQVFDPEVAGALPGRVYVADTANNRVQRFGPDGALYVVEELARRVSRIAVAEGRGAVDRRIGKTADTIQTGLFKELQQLLEISLGLAGKADNKRAAQRDIRAHGAPGLDTP